jgi:hypothetical protein
VEEGEEKEKREIKYNSNSNAEQANKRTATRRRQLLQLHRIGLLENGVTNIP